MSVIHFFGIVKSIFYVVCVFLKEDLEFRTTFVRSVL